jgi:hypothetical protein
MALSTGRSSGPSRRSKRARRGDQMNAIAGDVPVFVDPYGGRHRRVRRCLGVLALAGLVYVVLTFAVLVGVPGLDGVRVPGFEALRDPTSRSSDEPSLGSQLEDDPLGRVTTSTLAPASTEPRRSPPAPSTPETTSTSSAGSSPASSETVTATTPMGAAPGSPITSAPAPAPPTTSDRGPPTSTPGQDELPAEPPATPSSTVPSQGGPPSSTPDRRP